MPGIYEDGYPKTLTLWNTQTGSHQDLGDQYSASTLFSPDSKQIVLTKHSTITGYDEMVTFIDASNFHARMAIALPENGRAWPCRNFCAGGSICAVRLDIYAHANDIKDRKSELRFYDVGSGTELFRVSPLEKKDYFYPVFVAPGGQTLAALTVKPKGVTGPLLLLTTDTWRSQRIEFGKHTQVDSIAFHPNGKWLAVAVQIGEADPPSSYPPSLEPQSQIRILDAASGETLETLVTPQCYPASLAFSPDGKTLASSGKGEVLLWDFSMSPGAK